MANRVEYFEGDTPRELYWEINNYCARCNWNPISISVIAEHGAFYAFVVIEEGADNG